MTTDHDVASFIDRWAASGGAERANSQPFLVELCDLLGVDRPEPARPDIDENAYVFERTVVFDNGDGTTSEGRIDLYKRGCFVLESKQGVLRREAERDQRRAALGLAPGKRHGGTAVRGTTGWDTAMARAKGQAEQYVRALPPAEGRPPFLLVVDVGHVIELFSEFSCTGGVYVPFPDPQSHRLRLADLADPRHRETLRLVWTDPLALDPARRSARVTRDIAERLARLARSFEADGHAPEGVAQFLMRCLFTLFAEDVALLPGGGFTELLCSLRDAPDKFQPMVEDLWRAMKRGGFSAALRDQVRHFNGVLFEEATALPVDADQLELLIDAGRADWRDVEPAIFGTLLERALSPRERHKLGAHYTPRAYVERLVLPTVVEPLREEWDAARAAAEKLVDDGRPEPARDTLRAFHRRLCDVTVLDPACGSGNFLYVTLEHLKRLEGEVLDALAALGEEQGALEHTGATVGPHQLLGLEINPRAAKIAELVLWIGYLQWHVRTRGRAAPPEPIIGAFHNIERRDAVLDYDRKEYVTDPAGKVITRWDGHSTRPHPVTGEPVPDETRTVPVERFINPRPAVWPEAEFVVGNPPFIGKGNIRTALGDGYVEALRAAHPKVPDSADYVMFWWDHAAGLTRTGKVRRFGFITTNSLRQTFNRRVLERHLNGKPALSLVYAIPDHPWVDTAEGADVRIAMTAGETGEVEGRLAPVIAEQMADEGHRQVTLAPREGQIQPDLTAGPNVAGAVALQANDGLCSFGMMLAGSGFIVTPEQAEQLGLGSVPGLEEHIRPYRNGRDLTSTPRGVMVIDLYGLTAEEVRERFPAVWQWVHDRVRPEREAKRGRSSDAEQYAALWWLFAKPRPTFRPVLKGLLRFIATPETAKHRFFTFIDREVIPDHMVVAIALDDAYYLGVLSSQPHITWMLAAGGTLEDRPRYTKTRCFDPFPFPAPTPAQEQRIRELGEQLDGHRKARQAEHEGLTLTDMYNVLEKLRAGEALDDKERRIHEQGLVAVLKQIHDDLDAAVAAAYGWPAGLGDEAILERLVTLNAERAREEKQGQIRWLRPSYQNPGGEGAAQLKIDAGPDEAAPAAAEKRPWPIGGLPAEMRAVRAVVEQADARVDADAVARSFTKRVTAKHLAHVAELLETLAALGQIRAVEEGGYVAG